MATNGNSNSLSTQFDVGNLSLKSLSAVQDLLAIISADNVTPVALTQMEAIGSLFLISGPYAAKTPDCLQRCSSVRLDRLSLAVGWRKNDAASLMANTAGGQAAALLCLGIFSIFYSSGGLVLLLLSRKLLPATSVLASPKQLDQAGSLLKEKMSCLGFGNLLASQVHRIFQAYELLKKPAPVDLLEIISNDAIAEVLSSISQALRSEETIVRLKGTKCMGYIAGLVAMMFPEESLITVERRVILEGPRKSVIVDITTDHPNQPLCISFETILGRPGRLQGIELPFRNHFFFLPDSCENMSFHWRGWLSATLQLNLCQIGVSCGTELLKAIGQLLLTFPALSNSTGELFQKKFDFGHPFPGSPFNPLMSLLGQFPEDLMLKRCNEILNISLVKTEYKDPDDAFSALINTALQAATVSHVKCVCTHDCALYCDLIEVWAYMKSGADREEEEAFIDCPIGYFWYTLGRCVNAGLYSLFIDARDNACVSQCDILSAAPSDFAPATSFLVATSKRVPGHPLYRSGRTAPEDYGSSQLILASQRNGSILFPSTLYSLELCVPTTRPLWILADGYIISNGHLYRSMLAEMTLNRASKERLLKKREVIVPSSVDVPQSVLVTSLEFPDYLRLCVTARISGEDVPLNVYNAIDASLRVRRSLPCRHDPNTPLVVSDMPGRVFTLPVHGIAIGDRRRRPYLVIMQTKGDPTAQLFACIKAYNTMILHRCCLSCATKQLGFSDELSKGRTSSKGGRYMIIVS
ncbi:hypothetical protein L228DRAFT_244107 [Xylona heveae TC161]|uniref:Uncharacterized protein n=1 Tax=Xylona heveae (strain CBS 132557 / TC161) TaxID=1328760 RepID=A0A165IS25_XYLHT|nr:hypothetical protein L228DRAFT_244107 [Xylona heveae TC161]KZF25303.1 hypothetical protein L228DRAFT_244107 [Xylona heveae TC161]